MTTFVICAGALLLASLLVFAPLIRRPRDAGRRADGGDSNLMVLRHQLVEMDADLAAGTLSRDQYTVARSELERRVIEEAAGSEAARGSSRSPGMALMLAVALPVFAVGLYLYLGNRDGIAWQEFVAAGERGAAPADAQQVEDMVNRLAKGLENSPADSDGWLMLARSYGAMGRFAEAGRAYARAAALLPDNAQVLADYADALAMAQGRNAEGEPLRLVQRALMLDPDNLKALAFAGSAAFARRDFGAAAQYWQKALHLAPPGSDFARSMQEGLDESRKLAQGGPAPAARSTGPLAAGSAATGTAAAGATTGMIAGRVVLSAALAAKVAPSDTVFIFARASQGPRMPLAILRRAASELPLQFILDDSMAMAPEMQLSKYREVVVGARISKSGNAMPQPGDLQGQSGVIKTGSGGVEIVIDQLVP